MPDAVRINRIARLEKLKAATAALQAAESVRFAQSQAEAQMAADIHPDKIGRGIAETGWALHVTCPDSRLRVGSGELARCGSICRKPIGCLRRRDQRVCRLPGYNRTRHLDAGTRREVDAKIAAAGISQMGPRSAAACARKHSYEADHEAYVQRGRTEQKNRRVGLRPAPDTMSLLTGYLPAEQGIACLKALQQRTDR